MLACVSACLPAVLQGSCAEPGTASLGVPLIIWGVHSGGAVSWGIINRAEGTTSGVNAFEIPGRAAGLWGRAQASEPGVLTSVHSIALLQKTHCALPHSPASKRSLRTFTPALPAVISRLSRIFANDRFQKRFQGKCFVFQGFPASHNDGRRFPQFSKDFSTFKRQAK